MTLRPAAHRKAAPKALRCTSRLLSPRWTYHGPIDRRIEIANGERRRLVRKLPLAVPFGIERAIANRESLVIGPCQRLHEQNRLRHTGRHGRLMEIQTSGVLMNGRIGARLVRIRHLEKAA